MDRPPLVLAAVGVALALVALVTGGLSTGYGKGATAFLLRVGVAYLVLGATIAAFEPGTVREAIGVALATLVVTFAVGAAVMYYDLAVTPPEHGTGLTAALLLAAQVELTMALAPVPVGYVAGTLSREGSVGTGVISLLATAGVGWLGASAIARSRGSAPGFTELFFFLVAAAAVAGGLGPMLVGHRAG